MKLEVGKRNVRRDGKVTGPLSDNTGISREECPYWDCKHGCSYQTNGQYVNDIICTEDDLISEYVEPDTNAVNQAPTERSVLQEAEDIINGARQQTHGAKLATFGVIAAFWSVYLKTEIKPQDVAQMMSLMKKARYKCGQHVRDHFVDDIGYTAIAFELGEKK